jgi:hypothetical protein
MGVERLRFGTDQDCNDGGGEVASTLLARVICVGRGEHNSRSFPEAFEGRPKCVLWFSWTAPLNVDRSMSVDESSFD